MATFGPLPAAFLALAQAASFGVVCQPSREQIEHLFPGKRLNQQ
jgi:hypothetical protein